MHQVQRLAETTNLDVESRAPTPVNQTVLDRYLSCYNNKNDAKILSEGFSSGFKLQYEGPRVSTDCKNLESLNMLENEAIEIVLKEVSLGRIAGPFCTRPLDNLRLSPVGLIPKKDGSYRLIHHLSYPAGNSVNDFIPDEYCSVQYTSFDSALAMLANLGKGAIMTRLDIKSAFRQLPIHPSDFCLLGYKINEYFFVDKCLPFGCAISCALFEKFSSFLEWELKRRVASNNIVHYLDDFLIAGSQNTKECEVISKSFVDMCTEIGVPLAHDKTLGPSSNLTFLGLEINTVDMQVKIPSEKLIKLKTQLVSLLDKEKTTLKELQSLTGLLSFCCRAIPSARAFNRRFFDAMSGLSRPNHHVRVNLEMKSDIRMWLSFLELFNGTVYFDKVEWLDMADLSLFTDSAGNAKLGCAAIFRNHWVFLRWPKEWENKQIIHDITFLELVPVCLAFCIWANQLKHKKIIINTDNMALVSILNKKKHPNPNASCNFSDR